MLTPPPPLEGEPAELLKAGRGFTQPDVWIVGEGKGRRVWKTWRRRPAVERWAVGRWLARREGAIIRRLEIFDETPRFLGHPDQWTVEMSLLDAEPVPEVKRGGGLSEQYFDRLEAILDEMHRQGISHGDLRRKNLLRAPGNPSEPRLVDFTQCLRLAHHGRWPQRVLMREARRNDRASFLKLKKWYLPKGALTLEEERELANVPWHLSVARFVRKKIYRPWKHWRRGRG